MTILFLKFHYSPKRAELLIEIQHVLDLPDLKVIKSYNIQWLSRERNVKGVKANYAAIVAALKNIA